uniref:EMI domain-containing protein n=1 Tax=Malurus cyaneus samueli TaxID=2593467 RepID=A0A8C5UE24_9PASS
MGVGSGAKPGVGFAPGGHQPWHRSPGPWVPARWRVGRGRSRPSGRSHARACPLLPRSWEGIPLGKDGDIGGFPCSNWCSYTVTRTVSCHVQNGTFLQRVFQGCRWPLGCSGGSYRAVLRPLYRVTYRTLTALEWRCCPGHAGANCEEGGSRHGQGSSAWLVSIFGGAAPLALGELSPGVTPSHPRGQSSSGQGVADGGDPEGLSPGCIRVLLCHRDTRLEGPPRPQGDTGGRGPSGIPGVKGPVGRQVRGDSLGVEPPCPSGAGPGGPSRGSEGLQPCTALGTPDFTHCSSRRPRPPGTSRPAMEPGVPGRRIPGPGPPGPQGVPGGGGSPCPLPRAVSPPQPVPLSQGEGLHQLREALKILAERVLILETMIGLYGE